MIRKNHGELGLRLSELMFNYLIELCHEYKSYLIFSRTTKPLNVANKVVITPAG
jgi:hypothetical protein